VKEREQRGTTKAADLLRHGDRDPRLPLQAHTGRGHHRTRRRRGSRRRALRGLHPNPRGGRAARSRARPLTGGVLKAVGDVNGGIADALSGRNFTDLAELIQALIDLVGTPAKSRLEANAIVGLSMAATRVAAVTAGFGVARFDPNQHGSPTHAATCTYSLDRRYEPV
jgi:hypothetical protein